MARPASLVLCPLLVAALLVACAAAGPDAEARAPGCPSGMARVDPDSPEQHGFCIDRFEASLVEVGESGEKPFSPYQSVGTHKVKAVSRAAVAPQAYISRNEADAACKLARKRLCSEREWVRACEGKTATAYPYGNQRKPGYCNDDGRAPLATLYAGNGNAHSYAPMNDPRLNQLPGTLAKTGSHPHCRNAFGVFDMVGNVHEWIADPDGTFLGGFYLDTTLNGQGCHYKTVAHDAAYHDYSTGFRCCADAR